MSWKSAGRHFGRGARTGSVAQLSSNNGFLCVYKTFAVLANCVSCRIILLRTSQLNERIVAGKYRLKATAGGTFMFNLLAGNHQVILTSESCLTKQAR